ncbi:hypothetical protein TspCOW1_02130 [Thiohalobacter sp. COW1]|uniref:DUF6631 family protein n=1 Tax=Thiohalobacter sp. COW1 TaxID=2795687 RepID=UPI001915DE94|nr:DUF6631 family protein [Thiohalobacter sp. COW1]BCO30110.1 hypothetical protein TspCOW1_02130 [Thiohalobacter sp. COW1]
MNDLETLLPQPTVLEIDGARLEITPLRLGELPAMLKAVRPFAGQLVEEPDWLSLLAEQGEDLLEALCIACRRSREWVDALALDDALKLAAAVFEVNADFFVQKVVPNVTELAARIGQRLDGSTPPTGSSAPATASTTS